MKPSLATSLVAATLLASSSLSAENLLQAYHHAKGFDPQLKAVEESFQSTKESVVQANAALRTQVNLSAGANAAMQTGFPLFDNGYSDSHNANYSVTLNKPIYNKTLKAGKAIAKAGVDQARMNLEDNRQSLLLRTAESYFNVLLNKENVTFAHAEKKAIAKQLEQVKAHFEAGILAITDVKEVQSRYDQAASQEITAKTQLELAKEGLRVITGRKYGKYLGRASGIKLRQPTPNSVEAWLQLAERHNKQLQVSRQAVDVAIKTLDQQRAARKPTVDLIARHSGTYNENHDNDLLDRSVLDNSVGVQLNIPLYTSGATSSKIREALYAKRSKQHELQLQKQLVTQSVSSAYLTVISDISSIQSLHQVLDSSQTALEATQAGFEVGTRTAVDVLLSLRNVFAAKRDLARAQYNYLLNMLNLKQATGTITVKDLRQATAMLGK